MTLKEMKALKNTIIDQIVEINERAEKEVRSLSSEEVSDLRSFKNQLAEVENQIKMEQEEIRKSCKVQEIKNAEVKRMENVSVEQRAVQQLIRGEMGKELREVAETVTTSANGSAVIAKHIQNEIVKRLEEVAPLFAKASRYTVANGTLAIPQEDVGNLFDYGFVGEGEDVAEHALSFAAVTLDGHRAGAVITVTGEMVRRASIDVEGYVVDLLVRRLGASLDKAMITGETADKSFEGLDSVTGITEVTVEAIDEEALMDGLHALHPTLLNGAEYIMNRNTFNAVAKLRTADGQFVLMATKEIANGAPSYRIFGLPVSVNDAMEDDVIYVANIHEAYGALIREDAKLSRVAEDSVNLRRGTIQFFLEVDVDAKVKNKQAIVRICVEDDEVAGGTDQGAGSGEQAGA